MKDLGFEVMKELIINVVDMLPKGVQVRVAMVSFAVDAQLVFGFTNRPDASEIYGHRFTGNTFLRTRMLIVRPSCVVLKRCVYCMTTF